MKQTFLLLFVLTSIIVASTGANALVTTLEPKTPGKLLILDLDDKVIGELGKEETIEVVEFDVEDHGYYELKTKDGKTGFIKKDLIAQAFKTTLDTKLIIETFKPKADKISKINLSQKNCPLLLLDVKLTDDSIGTPQVSISYLNSSKKTVTAFSIQVICYDVYNDPVNKYGDNIFYGVADDENTKPFEIGEASWSLSLFDLTKTVKVRITKVLFSDGTKWVSK